MGRPAKNVEINSKHLTKEEKARRLEKEEQYKVASDKVVAPDYLTEPQVNIFNYIVAELKESGIVGNLDVFILATCAIAIDRLQEIETRINQKFGLIANNTIMAAKDKYSKDFYRCCNELSLSPQSRAKLANINMNKKEDDPLLAALREDDEDD